MLPPRELASLIERFYGEACTKDGRPYSRSSLVGIRAGLNRYLQSLLRPINIFTDREFMFANKILMGRIKKEDKNGPGIKHKLPIAQQDIWKMYASGVLSNNNPTSLQNKVFFEISLHLAGKGRDQLHDLKKNSFVFVKDEENSDVEYATVDFNDGKRRKGKEPRMYSVPSDPQHCPVKSLKLYLSKLHPGHKSFFQRPKLKFTDSSPIWYHNIPIGLQNIGRKMKSISHEAKLSQVYTNHSICVTASTVLANSSFNENDIISFTGHKDRKSVLLYYTSAGQLVNRELPYDSCTSSKLKRDMSATLFQYASGKK